MSASLPKNLLITGGAGFIGSNFIHNYLTNHPNANIINLDKLTYAGSLENLQNLPHPNQHEFVQGDIGDSALVSSLLRDKQIDTIVHFAAESHVDRSISGPATFIETNLVGTFTLLEAAREVWLNERKLDSEQCRFHHISTDEVFGSLSADDPSFTETTPYAPNSPYSASKAGSDHLVRAYFHTYGLPVTTSNCSNNYGPKQHPEKLIPTVLRACLQQTKIPVYGDGSNVRDWLYVTDHCEGIAQVLTKGTLGETYNFGGNNELSNLALIHNICTLLDERRPAQAPHASLIEFVDDRPGHDWRYSIDCSKVRETLGWTPSTAFVQGLALTLDAALTHPLTSKEYP